MKDKQKHIDYSQLLARLIQEEDDTLKLNDTILSFLYHMFPRELFVRAISLLESMDMFIYVLDEQNAKQCNKQEVTTSVSTEDDASTEEKQKLSPGPLTHQEIGSNNLDGLIDSMYNKEQTSLYRLIVKQEDLSSPPIYVDLGHWFCSCKEFTCLFQEELYKQDSCDSTLAEVLSFEIDTMDEPTEDTFSRLPSEDCCVRFFRHDQLMCPHLLAFGILLQTDVKILRYFTQIKSQVILLSVQNIDEWLKLQLNIVL